MLIGLLYLVLVPGRVTVRGDDFGYIESSAETIRSGHLMASHWLAPFNLLLPLLSWGIQLCSHNFWFATFGLMGAVAVLNVFLLQRWMIGYGPLAVIGVIITPWFLSKSLEYNGMALGFAFTTAALLAWRAGYRTLFFLLIIVGSANRQSIICLLAIPCVEVIRKMHARERWPIVLMILIIAAGAMSWGWSYLVPLTHGRMQISRDHLADSRIVQRLGNITLGIVVCSGLRAGFMLLRGESAFQKIRDNVRQWVLPAVVTFLTVWLSWQVPVDLRCQTPGLERVEPLLLVAAGLVGAWLEDWRRLPPWEMLASVTLYIILVTVRGVWWDTYFVEPAIILAWPTQVVKPESRGCLYKCILVGAGLAYSIALGIIFRRSEAKLLAYEDAIREDKLTITMASDAPFGWLGWRLFYYSRTQHPEAKMSNFLEFVQAGRSRFRGGQLQIFPSTITRSIYRTGERWSLYDYKDRPFPRDNEEWQQYFTKWELPYNAAASELMTTSR